MARSVSLHFRSALDDPFSVECTDKVVASTHAQAFTKGLDVALQGTSLTFSRIGPADFAWVLDQVGVHRFVDVNSHDAESRRQTCFITCTAGIARTEVIRSYVASPYTMVKDSRNGWETEDLDGVLSGERVVPTSTSR